MTAEELAFWIARHEVQPIGVSGVVQLVALFMALHVSTERQKVTPEEIMAAAAGGGFDWNPRKPDPEEPITGQQLAMLASSAGVRASSAIDWSSLPPPEPKRSGPTVEDW